MLTVWPFAEELLGYSILSALQLLVRDSQGNEQLRHNIESARREIYVRADGGRVIILRVGNLSWGFISGSWNQRLQGKWFRRVEQHFEADTERAERWVWSEKERVGSGEVRKGLGVEEQAADSARCFIKSRWNQAKMHHWIWQCGGWLDRHGLQRMAGVGRRGSGCKFINHVWKRAQLNEGRI